MDTNDDTQVLLQMVALSKRLSSNPVENIISENLTLRKQHQDDRTIIDRFTEDKHNLLQQSKAAADEIQKLKNTVDSLREEIAQTKNDLAETERVAEDRGQRLREETAKAMQLKQYRVDLKVESRDDIAKRWIQLWTLVNKLATEYFSEDLDLDTLRAASGWEPTSHQYPKNFPCPATNFNEAKQMRIVAVDSVVASALTRHIFRSIGRDDGFARAMSELAHKNPDMESFYRSSHLAVLEKLQEYRDFIVDRAVKAAIADIMNSVGHILPAETVRQFRIHLEDVCRTAEREWQIFLQYKERYEVDMVGEEHCYDPVPLWQPAKANSPKVNGAAKNPAQDQARNNEKGKRPSPAEGKVKSVIIVTSVWPFLKVVDATGAVPKVSGFALFSDQAKEAEEQVMRANRQATREEAKRDEKKSSPKPLSLGTFLSGSPKSA